MTTLFISAGLPYSKGETFYIPEFSEMLEANHSFLLYSLRHFENESQFPDRRIKKHVYAHPTSRRKYALSVVKYSIGNLKHLLKLLKIMICSRQPLRALIRNIAIIPRAIWIASNVQTSGITHVHSLWASTPASLAFAIHLLTGVKFSMTAHRWDIMEDNLFAKKYLYGEFCRFISADGQKEATQKYDLNPSKSRVIHLGVLVPSQPISPVKRRVISVVVPANLIERKGHIYLLEAIKGLSREEKNRIRVDLIGDGPELSKLKDYCEINNIENINFCGHVKNSEMMELYRSGVYDLCILPSLHEGISVGVMEAMSYGIPSICSNVGGMFELLGDGGGELIAPGDVLALRSSLRVFINDDEVRARAGVEAHLIVKNKFNASGTFQAIIHEIERL